jgi:hypothetical protein
VEYLRVFVAAKVPHVACVLARFCCRVALFVVFTYCLSMRQSLVCVSLS